MKQDKTYTQCLEDFINFQQAKKSAQDTFTYLENQHSPKKKELLGFIEDSISKNCSSAFLERLHTDINQHVRSACGIDAVDDGEIKSNIDFLTNVLFFAITKEEPPLGLNYFIFPGNTYVEGEDFFREFHKDILKIKELFTLEVQHQEQVKIGYARRFYKLFPME